MRKIYFIYFLIFSFSCKNDQKQVVEDELRIPKLIKLVSEKKNDADFTIPKTEIFLELDAYKIKIATILNGESIGKESYSQYQIPETALSAAGGWWAGSGDYFYVTLENGKYIVYQGVMDEFSNADDYDYRAISAFDRKGTPVYSLAELVGFYTAGGHDASWILFAGMNNDSLKVEFFEVDGMLPPEKEITRYLGDFKKTKIQNFNVDLNNLTFESDLGSGIFYKDGRKTSILFYDKKNQLDEELELKRIDY